MSLPEHTTETSAPSAEHGTLTSYCTGFALSLLFTALPYLVVVNDWARGAALWAILGAFAIAQLMVQLVFFLHLGGEARPRWKLQALLFAVGVVAIVVLGSIWIMYNLDYNMMPAHEVDEHIMQEEGIRK